MPDHAVLKSHTLDQIARRCQQETERFYQDGQSDDSFCFELFRRAIVERLQEAWELVFDQYMPLVIGWVSRHPAFSSAAEEREYFANRAFERMWHAMSPEKFGRMANLKALISYLKLCVHAAVLEHVERRINPAEWSEADMENDVNTFSGSAGDTVAGSVEAEMVATEIWQMITELVKSEEELILARCTFIYEMKPSEVVEYFPDHFQDVKQVYRQKENLLARIHRNDGLRAILVGRT